MSLPPRTDAPWAIREFARQPRRVDERVDGVQRHAGQAPPRPAVEALVFSWPGATTQVESSQHPVLIGGLVSVVFGITTLPTSGTYTLVVNRNGTQVGSSISITSAGVDDLLLDGYAKAGDQITTEFTALGSGMSDVTIVVALL